MVSEFQRAREGSNDLMYDVFAVIEAVDRACGLIPVEGSDDFGLDGASRQRDVKAT